MALKMRNGEAVDLGRIDIVSIAEFRQEIVEDVEAGARLVALFGRPQGSTIQLFAVVGDPVTGTFSVLSTRAQTAYQALTPACPQAHWFERELWEKHGLLPEGHPWLKPIRFEKAPVGVTEYFCVQGDEVHEVAVGPVHAGIIEPGHFRFQCHGEQVLHVEIALGYQHRGVERALVGGPNKRTIHYMETLAGDTSVGHATAYCQLVEALAGVEAPLRAQMLRGIALELERLANHTGDLGALANDVGYLPTASYCGRLRGEFLNMTALICGSRFGRGLVRPGGVGFDLSAAQIAELRQRLERAFRDVTGAVNLLWETASVQARFEGTGVISPEICEAVGLVGVAARACGLERDGRTEFPCGIFRFFHIPVSTYHTGDVFARAYVRWLEMQRSVAFIQEQLTVLADGPVQTRFEGLAPQTLALALVEGWRGEICHVALTDERGRFSVYKIVDPSFHNWIGLALAMRNGQISDFPLCNKSFNLSYCGHDL
uniref:NADH ubiquinone oxidoreductase subunit n=1 Tax=Acetithermum autotrophicum TaxID=1446466 RepID=H5SSR9_ACEAU|nr:NADH ubiquinone oxidoreductase subunit [Candidatus Acetothermum autotrophicum]